MDRFVIQGGTPLEGKVEISGAKNSALKLMAACILAEGLCEIRNVPDIDDVRTMMEVLRNQNLGVESPEDGTIQTTPAEEISIETPYHLVRKMRASIIVMGPLLARFGKARIAMPGGCNIGSRQIDLHLSGLRKLGATIKVSHGYIEAEAPRLRGTHIYLDFASVGATENLMMAGVLAKGMTIIENPAKEPELVDLANFLNKMGANIRGVGTSTIEIEGVEGLRGATHSVIPDRIEAGTYLLAGATTGGRVTVEHARADHLELPLEKMADAGVELEMSDDAITASIPGKLESIEVATLPYPGFPTDLQPQMLVLLSLADGVSFVTENIFDNRFMIVDELNRMGSDIRTQGHHAIIRGVRSLSGAPVLATDLRSGAALILAGLVAEGTTEVGDIGHVDRGYEGIERKLSDLGAKIERVS